MADEYQDQPTDPERRPRPLHYATKRGNLPDPIEHDHRHQLGYAAGRDRSPMERFARGCIYALAITLLIIGLLFGTCMIMMSR